MQKPNISNMDLKILIVLIRQHNNLDSPDILSELSKRLKNSTKEELLVKWYKEKKSTLKELLEITIAEKYNDKPLISINKRNEKLSKCYLEQVSSLDAIYKLMQSPDETIRQKATLRYQDFINDYLDMIDKDENTKKLYQLEGDDTLINDKCSNIISFETAKIKKEQNKIKVKKS